MLRGGRHALSEDLREVSLVLAGWMLHMGGKAASPEAGHRLAGEKLENGSAWEAFRRMVEAQGGEVSVLEEPERFHQPAFRRTLRAARSGYLTAMDCTQAGWAVQRLGAGRERAGEPVETHAGLEMHAKLGMRVEAGQPLCTMFAQQEARFDEPEHLLAGAITIAEEPVAAPPLVKEIITDANKSLYLKRRGQ